MISNFYMPTRIVAGAGSLGTVGKLARDLGMSRALVVSDPVISAQPFHADALLALAEAGVATARFDECGIDARCSHIDALRQARPADDHGAHHGGLGLGSLAVDHREG